MQYHRGRATNCEVWVFGMVDTSHDPALGYMQIVQQSTLLPISSIAMWQLVQLCGRISGLLTMLYQDCLMSVLTVHSIKFVNSAAGVHTQNIESYWNRVKTKIKRMRGSHDHQSSCIKRVEKNA